MMRRNFISAVTGGILVLLLAGAMEASALQATAQRDTLRQGAPTPSADATAGGSVVPPAKPLPAAVPATAYSYNAAGKPDPFKPFMETDPALKTKKKEEPKKKTETLSGSIYPLQRQDIGQFRLVGIAGDQKRCVAIVEDGAAKRYYPIFVGTFIGLNGGRVSAILPDRVIVEEKAEKESKKSKIKRVTMLLHKEEEGRP